MSIEELELNWRVGAHRYSLVLGPDGLPHFSGPVSGGGGEPTPLAPDAPERPARAARLRDRFDRGETPSTLARAIGRSAGAVRARLVRMDLLAEADAKLRYPVARPEEGGEEPVGADRGADGS